VKNMDRQNIGALIALDSADVQTALVAAFEAVGIAQPLQADKPESLRRILATANLDLIVLSSALDGVYVAPMISEIRRGQLGPHPFPIVVVLVTDATPAALRLVSNCGPDDIVALPCAPQDMLDRINVFLAGSRRPLVVNDGYAGPERRNAGRA
jgi:two-component system phosphate regulon response regulator PhoB